MKIVLRSCKVQVGSLTGWTSFTLFAFFVSVIFLFSYTLYV